MRLNFCLMRSIAEQIVDAGLIVIIRTSSSEHLVEAARALEAGGVRAMEITLNTPGALAAIAAIRSALPGMLCGAGTILTPDDAAAALGAGAQFIVTPTLQLDTVAFCRERGVPVTPGCASPTEALAAHRAGADFIKVFPAATLGLVHIAALLEELPELRLVPTGGVTPENCEQYFRAGCALVAAGSAMSKSFLEKRDCAGLTAMARKFTDAVAAAKRASGK
jgi:2-dehydro-3-deoxyphosphogluconate aldolase/(4S)-4-hydroxy-2-oxoglutarate aldolase